MKLIFVCVKFGYKYEQAMKIKEENKKKQGWKNSKRMQWLGYLKKNPLLL